MKTKENKGLYRVANFGLTNDPVFLCIQNKQSRRLREGPVYQNSLFKITINIFTVYNKRYLAMVR